MSAGTWIVASSLLLAGFLVAGLIPQRLQWRVYGALYALLALLLALAVVGCTSGGSWTMVGPSSSVEEMLISETARFAGILKVRVRGVVTDTQLASAPSAVGWYQAGVAYYYRPLVQSQIVLADGDRCPDYPRCATATDVAAHEVCHAISNFHDVKHWDCTASVARPTYPHP